MRDDKGDRVDIPGTTPPEPGDQQRPDETDEQREDREAREREEQEQIEQRERAERQRREQAHPGTANWPDSVQHS